MRIVHLRNIREGDLTGKPPHKSSDRRVELINSRGDSVYFLDPKLLRSVFGTKILDMNCTRVDRLFSSMHSYGLVRGTFIRMG